MKKFILALSVMLLALAFISQPTYAATSNNLYAQWCGTLASKLPTPTRTGYTFTGWTDASNTTHASGDTITTALSSLQANWTTITYTITYNYNGGTGSNPTSYTVNSGTINLSTPTRSGYTFTGWTGSNTSGVISAGTTGNLSFTANWKVNFRIVWTGASYALWQACGGINSDGTWYYANYGCTSNYASAKYELYGPFYTSAAAAACTSSSTHSGRLRGVSRDNKGNIDVDYWTSSDSRYSRVVDGDGYMCYWVLAPAS